MPHGTITKTKAETGNVLVAESVWARLRSAPRRLQALKLRPSSAILYYIVLFSGIWDALDWRLIIGGGKTCWVVCRSEVDGMGQARDDRGALNGLRR
jgi:hypothetical protein